MSELRIDIKQPTLYKFGLFYNLHAHLIYMQVCETFLSKKWQTVRPMWHRECKQSIHVPRGLDLGGSLGLEGQGQGEGEGEGQDFSLKAKAKAKTFIRCSRGQGQTSRTTIKDCSLSWSVHRDDDKEGDGDIPTLEWQEIHQEMR